MIDKYHLDFEFPINEGYIWVEITEDTISSGAVPMCLECGKEEGISYCDWDCIKCDHVLPEMIRRRERVLKLYDQMAEFIEVMALDMREMIEKKLEEIT